MTDKPFIKWIAMSDSALATHIGQFIRHHRMELSRTQEELSKEAGISRSTLSLLERGETVTLATLIQVLRSIGQLDVMFAFTITESISPLALIKHQKEKRQRARSNKPDDTEKSNW